MEKNDLYFDKNKVWLAEMKYYSKENNGIEYREPLTYAFIVDLDNGEYANPFDFSEDLPVFKRVPYANYTQDGESYGTKVLLVSNVDKSGACFVLNKSAAEMGIEDDIVSSEQLIDYMFQNREMFFKDRRQFASDKLRGHPFTLRKLMESDEAEAAKMTAYLAEKRAHIRLVK